MSAQTAPAHTHVPEPITPVIIKTGGDDDDPTSKDLPGHRVTIQCANAIHRDSGWTDLGVVAIAVERPDC